MTLPLLLRYAITETVEEQIAEVGLHQTIVDSKGIVDDVILELAKCGRHRDASVLTAYREEANALLAALLGLM